MSISSKSPRRVALVAWEAGKEALPDYSHPNSPRIFTQPQLFACLVLKRFFKTDYRGIIVHLRDMPAICETIELAELPHFSTLQKANDRLLKLPLARKLLDSSVRLTLGDQARVDQAAADSTGLQSGHVSSYFVRRRSREPGLWQTTTYRRFPKLGIACDIASHLILGFTSGYGPRPDVDELAELLDEIAPSVRLHHLLADAGYDSEWNHVYAREYHSVLTTIPARIGRPTDKPPTGRYRRLMKRSLHTRTYYGQRWQIETVNSMIKRNQGEAILAVKHHAQQRELRLACLTHNLAILLFIEVFYRAYPTPFRGPVLERRPPACADRRRQLD